MTKRGMSVHRPALACALAVVLVAGSLGVARAQPGGPNMVQGFSQNSDQPIQINAASLEVRDKDKVATFSGNVHVVQGESELRCVSLVVYYEQEGGQGGKGGQKGAQPAAKGGQQSGAQAGQGNASGGQAGAGGGKQQIRRLEAKGNVIFTQKDQTATGENAIFDPKSNTVTMIGNVVMTQGPHVIRGERVVVDMTTGISRVEAGKSGSGVRALIQPGGLKDNKPPTGGGRDDAKPPQRPARPN